MLGEYGFSLPTTVCCLSPSLLSLSLSLKFLATLVLVVKNPPANAGDGVQSLDWDDPLERGAWWATVHSVPKNRTRLKQLSMVQHVGS